MKVQIKTLLKEPFEPAPPLAIRMANNLDLAVLDPMWPDEAVVPKYICEQASAELHRLHEENKDLRERLTQPEREWVGLTDEEVDEIYIKNIANANDFVRVAEAKLKEKNT